MEMIKDRLVFLRKKARLTQEELAEKLNISSKVISKWENGDSEPSVADLRNISDLYGVSFDYLISGKASDEDLRIINREPTSNELADDFLKQCYDIIKEKNYLRMKDQLLPKKVLTKNPDYVPYLEGGIFKSKNHYEWQNVYTPYIDIKKLVAFDDYLLYKAFIDLPATFGEMRYQMRQNNDLEGLAETEPKSGSTDEWTREKPKEGLDAEDVKGLKDYRFARELRDEREALYALEALDFNAENYWYWVLELIERGAIARKKTGWDEYYCSAIFEDDPLKTKLLHEMAKEKIKEDKKK